MTDLIQQQAQRTKLVAQARSWLGTPYQHQAACKGAGCDCLGLILGLWRELHGALPQGVPSYSPDWRETERDEVLWNALSSACSPAVQSVQPGQILLFRMRSGSVAKHLGLVSEVNRATKTVRFIHAYSGHGVVENTLSSPWARRVVVRFDMI